MKHYEIDKNLKPPKIEMILYKNKNEAICKINTFSNAINKVTMGNINELNFDIPYFIDKNNKNQLWDKIKYRYLILFKYNNIKEWYTITDFVKNSSNNIKMIQTKSTPYLLRGVKLYNYEAVSYTIEEILNGNQLDDKRGILYNTTWSLGYVDGSIKNKRRGITMTGETTVLDAIFTIAEKFNTIIEWDTEREIINFYDEETYGEDKGLLFQYNKYLESIKEEEKTDEMCTILKVQGKDGIEISSLNPTGKTYLTDYSYFMYPFETDDNGNVLQHSDYMSDELCLALLKFDKVINENKGKLRELITKKYIYKNAIAQKEMQLSDLHGEYDAILKKLSIAQSTNSQKNSILEEKKKKFKQIQQREKDIKYIKEQKQIIETQINSIKYLLSESSNFKQSELEELKQFREEKTYINNNITDEKELYLSANEYFEKIKQPKKVITLNIVNFLKVVEAQKDWSKLKIGDIVAINYHKFNIDKMKAKIIEFNINHQSMTIDITIANVSDTDDDNKKFAKLLYGVSSTSAIVDETPSKLNTLKDTVNNLNEIVNNTWKTAQRQIFSGTNNTTIINQLGLTSMESENKKRGLRINNGTLQVTNEGDNFFRTIINGDGYIDVKAIQGNIDKDTDIKININNVENNQGEKVENIIDNKVKKLKIDTDKAVEDLTNRADKQIKRADELADYIDSLTDDVGVFKIETEKALATKVANEEFKSYRMQTANLIADKVNNYEFNSWRTQSAQMIADKVSSNTFESYRIQTDKEIMDRVRSSEFNSYIYQTDKKIDLVVDGYGNINGASIAMAIKDNSSAISIISDSIDIKPRNGVINFPNGQDIDCRSNGIRLRRDGSHYINIADGGIYFYTGSNSNSWQFTSEGVFFHGKRVKLEFS